MTLEELENQVSAPPFTTVLIGHPGVQDDLNAAHAVRANTNADAIADEASAIIKRAADLVMKQIEETQAKLDGYREHLIHTTLAAENSIKHTMMTIGQIGLSAVAFDKQVDELIQGSKVLT